MVILPYRFGSKSARALAAALRIRRTRRSINSPNAINWGSGNTGLTRTVNKGNAVANAGNKLAALTIMNAAGVPTVEFTGSAQIAAEWKQKHLVYARTLLRSSSGKGIVLLSKESDMVGARLYTKYAKNKHEYRIHVFNGAAIYSQKKRRRNSTDLENNKIRNLANGWVFCTGNVEVPDTVTDAAILAVSSLGLTFGAVDVGYRERDGGVFVFEVNTAPGITGSTVTAYVNAIRGLYNGR